MNACGTCKDPDCPALGGGMCAHAEPKPVKDDPTKLLAVGTRMNDRLIDAVTQGLSHGEDEDTMILTIYSELCKQSLRQTAAHALAGIFAQAHARKWDLVLAKRDGTRVVIPCDTQEEQTARALEIAKGQ